MIALLMVLLRLYLLLVLEVLRCMLELVLSLLVLIRLELQGSDARLRNVLGLVRDGHRRLVQWDDTANGLEVRRHVGVVLHRRRRRAHAVKRGGRHPTGQIARHVPAGREHRGPAVRNGWNGNNGRRWGWRWCRFWRR